MRVLAAQARPDHAMIARFVDRDQEAIAGLFGEQPALWAKSGLVSVGVIAVDATKLPGNASPNANAHEREVRGLLGADEQQHPRASRGRGRRLHARPLSEGQDSPRRAARDSARGLLQLLDAPLEFLDAALGVALGLALLRVGVRARRSATATFTFAGHGHLLISICSRGASLRQPQNAPWSEHSQVPFFPAR